MFLKYFRLVGKLIINDISQIANVKKTLNAQSGSGGIQEADMAGGSSSSVGGGESSREALSVASDSKKKQPKGKSIRTRGKT